MLNLSWIEACVCTSFRWSKGKGGIDFDLMLVLYYKYYHVCESIILLLLLQFPSLFLSMMLDDGCVLCSLGVNFNKSVFQW